MTDITIKEIRLFVPEELYGEFWFELTDANGRKLQLEFMLDAAVRHDAQMLACYLENMVRRQDFDWKEPVD